MRSSRSLVCRRRRCSAVGSRQYWRTSGRQGQTLAPTESSRKIGAPRGRPLAGMDGNRTHPGRVIGAPQTVLKTAGLAPADDSGGPYKFAWAGRPSVTGRCSPSLCACVAVVLAVAEPEFGLAGATRATQLSLSGTSVSPPFGFVATTTQRCYRA